MKDDSREDAKTRSKEEEMKGIQKQNLRDFAPSREPTRMKVMSQIILYQSEDGRTKLDVRL